MVKSRKPPASRKPGPPPTRAARRCPIVGVGASAGGLEAFTQLLKELPVDTGCGFVLVQHLDPQHESALAMLLRRVTPMPVLEVKNDMRVEANHVYIIPPNTSLGIARGVLKLQPRQKDRSVLRSIDLFLEALAQDQRERAIGVILSGTATDGTLGLEAIKAEGGLTFAQDDSARYDSMPRSAIAAGCVDFVLSPGDIARELAHVARHPYVAGHLPERPGPSNGMTEPGARDGETPPSHRPARASGAEPQSAADTGTEGYQKILLLLRGHCGVDFSLYKEATIRRRITRRTVLNRQDTLEDYAGFLRGNPGELDALYSDALIGVTSFFRNAEAFDVLQRRVFAKLLKGGGDEPVRVWVLGCSTGQEAYSMAMAYAESANKFSRPRKLQVFATDLNEANLEKARLGFYAKSLVQDVTPKRLRRFFVEEEGGYRIIKQLRELVVFARHNVISDPPFSRMDLISCRNVMIYLETALQKKLIPNFHYSLKPGGFLFLGASESVVSFTHLFSPVDKRQKIYLTKAVRTPAFNLPGRKDGGGRPPRERKPRPTPPAATSDGDGRDAFQAGLNIEREADRVTVNQFAPPAVLVNSDLQILQFRGPTGAYLQPPTGKASFDLLKMARDGLMLPLRAAINSAKKDNRNARREGVPVRANGKTLLVNVEVVPLRNLKERCFLVLFEDSGGQLGADPETPPREPPAAKPGKRRDAGAKERSGHVARLERDLSETRDYLQSLQEQHEAANEELQASNEEGQSANEELQSLNEELETSKEELESTNEELTTVNDEMVSRNTELSRLNSDLTNLQTSTKLVIVLLGRDLAIRRFSVSAERQFNLLASDVGRPIRSVRHNLQLPDLDTVITKVITGGQETELEVQDRDGRWHLMRLRPYLTADKKVDGAVLVLLDIDELKRTERIITEAHEHAEAIIRTVPNPLLILTSDLRVRSANDAFIHTFKVALAKIKGRPILKAANGAWNFPGLRRKLEDVVARNTSFDEFEVTRDFDRIGSRSLLLSARILKEPGRKLQEILLGIRDVTEPKRAEAALRASEERFRALFDLGPIGVYTCDTDGTIQEFNRCAVELWGRTPKSGDPSERFCGSLRMHHPDGTHLPHADCPMAAVLDGRMPAARDIEVVIERPGGSRITAIVNIVPLKNERGETTGAINCFYDITERKRSEEALNKARNQLSLHAEQLEHMVAKRTTELTTTNKRLESSVDSIRRGNEDVRTLLAESHVMQKKLRHLTHKVIAAQEEERKEISRELHDEVVQTLIGINVELSAIGGGANSGGVNSLKRKIAHTQRLVANSVDAVHRFARGLRPAVLDDLGLIPALHAHCKALAARKKIKIHMVASGSVEELGGAERTVLFRVAQEALNNVARHAHATQVKMGIRGIPGAIRMEISDNGTAFDVGKFLLAKKPNRLGLVGMRERVEMVGGSLDIKSVSGTGTIVRVDIPFSPGKEGS